MWSLVGSSLDQEEDLTKKLTIAELRISRSSRLQSTAYSMPFFGGEDYHSTCIYLCNTMEMRHLPNIAHKLALGSAIAATSQQ